MEKKMIFDTHGQDSNYKKYDGTVCEVIGPLDEKEYDKKDIGPMFEIKLHDGTITEAFEDELQKIQ